MHYLLECRNCKGYLGGLENNPFLYCSEQCKDEKETKIRENNSRTLKDIQQNAVVKHMLYNYHNGTHDEETGQPKKVCKTTGKPRKARVEKGLRKCGKCGNTGHNARTCPRR